jgi:hypothetical protein
MKADKAIRMLKTVEPVAITHFDDPLINPQISPITGYSNGWTVVNTSIAAGYSIMTCEWSDTIDIAGLAANDISLINAGGAVARPASPYTTITSECALSQMTIVSVNPIELTANDLFLANALSREGNLQDYFLATNQEFVKAADSVYIFTKSGEHNFGTGGIAQATKLYVKSFVISYAQRPLGIPSDEVFVSPATVAVAGVTADLDPVQMAAAIYRANDQE